MHSPSAGSPADWAIGAATLPELDARLVHCRACPRLVAWREAVAGVKRAAYARENYWARPVPGIGAADARILVVGLAPAAHGGNRTGRMFTGDRSGDVLYAALYRAGLASQPTSTHVGDGLRVQGVRITAPVHCAPPDNLPTPAERDTCAPYLSRELELLTELSVIVVLGGFGWQSLLSELSRRGWGLPRPRPRFGHGAEAVVNRPDGRAATLLGCYHVSQQNTFTGRLTPDMLDDVFRRALALSARDVR